MAKKRKTRFDELQEVVHAAGFYVATYSPGDGVTRYRFFEKPSGYFGPDSGMYTALGYKEALAFAQGLSRGKETRHGRTR